MKKAAMIDKLNQIDDLPTLPVIVLELNRTLQNYEAPIAQVTALIEKDQAMVPRILKLVNSAFFGFRSRISNIGHAVSLLGFNMIRNALVSVAVIDAFADRDLNGLDMALFWTHSVKVAVLSRFLAASHHMESPEDAFTAGLIHDIGKIVLRQYFPDQFKSIWEQMQHSKIDFAVAERQVCTLDHARIGAYLSKKWQLPQSLVDALRYHHTTSRAASNPDLVLTVHTADRISHAMVEKPDIHSAPSDFHPDAKKRFAKQIETRLDWYPGVCEEIDEACQFFIQESDHDDR